MSTTEEPTIKPTEAEAPAPTEPSATEAVVAETAPEAAILSKDPEVVAENLAKAEVVETPAATTSEETPAEAIPATPEKKEGSSLLNFIKKHVPNPKAGADKKAPAMAASGKSAAQSTETPAKSEIEPVAPATTEPVVVEPEEETPFEGGYVSFKTHGGLFGGGWKQRQLLFGKEDPYSSNALMPFVTAHKATSYVSAADKTNAAWENAAHAGVTGVGLLFLVKTKALDIPLNIINLAEVKEVTVNASYFTVKTDHSGDYEFNSNSPTLAKTWKTEIDKKVEQSKLTRSAVLEKEEYKTLLASYKDPKAAHHAKSPEAVTSDEEGALSGEDTNRPKKGWSRRISGNFSRLTGSSKDSGTTSKEIAPEVPKKDESSAPVAEAAITETPAVEETAPVTTETAPVETTETTTEAVTEPSKKDKRKSLSGFGSIFGKSKAAPKEPSPEPSTAKATEPTPTTETAVEETTPAPVTEETPAATSETKPEKEKKRGSLFAGLKPKKDTKDKATTTPIANGETTETTEPPTTSEAVAPTEETPAATTSETTPETPKKDSLGRRLTSSFKAFGRSKSPDKGKATKVSDEAPKIDTAIESTPETATAVKTEEEPLSTTEAPLAPVEIKEEPKTAPVVSTQA